MNYNEHPQCPSRVSLEVEGLAKASLRCLQTTKEHTSGNHMQYHPDGKHIICWSDDRPEPRVWSNMPDHVQCKYCQQSGRRDDG